MDDYQVSTEDADTLVRTGTVTHFTSLCSERLGARLTSHPCRARPQPPRGSDLQPEAAIGIRVSTTSCRAIRKQGAAGISIGSKFV
ncbi:hypothetical protein KM043_004488 [Ampulex compressa]|nr:hypothetical protein KM043_004488 [Ampulex compressa]